MHSAGGGDLAGIAAEMHTQSQQYPRRRGMIRMHQMIFFFSVKPLPGVGDT